MFLSRLREAGAIEVMAGKARAQGSARYRLWTIVVSLGLICLIWIVFGQANSFSFLSYDDAAYVTNNPDVFRGLSPHALVWAFTHSHAENWHPLTTLSHMLDCQTFGLNAGRHHLVNVFLHTIATLLLFLFVLEAERFENAGTSVSRSLERRSTHDIGRAAFVAAVFAVHPLRVESVAWVAERKDVLSGVFFMLTLLAYFRYVSRRTTGSYVLTAILLACGLMSKPMLVTTPLVMLLLDYWPLGRARSREQGAGSRERKQTWSQLVVEKIPFFALSIASSVITVLVQKTAVSSLENLPLSWRIQNAIVSCVTYLFQLIWPFNLAVFYPHPQGRLGLWQVVGAVLFLLLITVVAFALRKSRPYLVVGWLWYLIMLAPVIGVVQVGLQGHADRYTYLPLVGPVIAITWLLADWLAARGWIYVARVGGAAVVVVLTLVARVQAGYWRDSETLWTHALAVTSDNDVAHNNLGNVLLNRGEFDAAVAHFQEALKIRTRKGESQYGQGAALSDNNLGIAFVKKGRVSEGIDYYRKALEIWPEYADAHYNLGTALFQEGALNDAITEWKKTLEIHPQDAGANTSLGDALLQKGLAREAIPHYEAALIVDPDSVGTLNNLAWVLATHPDPAVRNGARAVTVAERAVRISGGSDAGIIRTLAAAYAEAGRFSEAVETAQRALEITVRENNSEGTSAMTKDLDLYRAHTPLRDPSLSNGPAE